MATKNGWRSLLFCVTFKLRYKENIKRIPQKEIYRYIEDGHGTDIPLPALVWFAVRSQHEDIDEIEAMVFAATHICGHRALRLYDVLKRALPDSRPEYVMKELNEALRSNEKLQTKCNRLEWKREQFKSEIESIKEGRSKINTVMEGEKQLNRQLTSDLERLGGENALGQIENLKKEIALLTEEVTVLTDELLKRDRTDDMASGELTDGRGQYIAYSCEISSVKNIAHPMVRYGRIKRNIYRRGTGAYQCGQSISERRTPF